ncbi:hypothetical protein PGTUg99_000064 [Puccinia graminis f. sp. tritici]|uniref:Uncharacterized protein n=1 Tax=Puccinia graminis f. sp. tritici TaxID=56615 RepID=A0A5B0SFL2_PUCGR|nr:hypothetical protein PGTUg99_000064 [Puccinia graminis f. sp. tritici]
MEDSLAPSASAANPVAQTPTFDVKDSACNPINIALNPAHPSLDLPPHLLYFLLLQNQNRSQTSKPSPLVQNYINGVTSSVRSHSPLGISVV